MSRLRFNITTSLDGYVAGPDATLERPLGVGDDLHGLELDRTIAAPGVTHRRFRRR